MTSISEATQTIIDNDMSVSLNSPNSITEGDNINLQLNISNGGFQEQTTVQFWRCLMISLILFIFLRFAYDFRYLRQTDLSQLDLTNEVSYFVPSISFEKQNKSDNFFEISFELKNQSHSRFIRLKNINISLFLPLAPPEIAKSDKTLTSWFVNEREFNRQRVSFNSDSPHLIISQDKQPAPKLAVDLTNNCLGVGYWELNVYTVKGEDKSKIYKGFFKFPRGAYKSLFEDFNQSSFWPEAPNIEAWFTLPFMNHPPAWDLLINGKKFSFDKLRNVVDEKNVAFTEEKTRIAKGEQARKEQNLLISPSLKDLKTFKSIREHNNIKFVRFVPPGIYNKSNAPLVKSKLGEIANLNSVILRDIHSPLAEETLQELELSFISEDGEIRNLFISGFNFEQLPQLSVQEYDKGLVVPLGYGPPFTQDYEELKANPPHKNPFFSVLVDEHNRIIDYRYDVGLNGLIMHRDLDNPYLLHIYLMSYERILLVGHYSIAMK